MDSFKKFLLGLSLLPLLATIEVYGDTHFDQSGQRVNENQYQNNQNNRNSNYHPNGYNDRYQNNYQQGYHDTNYYYRGVYPGFGGYLAPGPVMPGQDEADAIYRANQHPNMF